MWYSSRDIWIQCELVGIQGGLHQMRHPQGRFFATLTTLYRILTIVYIYYTVLHTSVGSPAGYTLFVCTARNRPFGANKPEKSQYEVWSPIRYALEEWKFVTPWPIPSTPSLQSHEGQYVSLGEYYVKYGWKNQYAERFNIFTTHTKQLFISGKWTFQYKRALRKKYRKIFSKRNQTKIFLHKYFD